MFIGRWFAILVAILAMSATLHAQDVIQNGGFTQSAPRVGDGSIPPNQVTNWTQAYGTPQLITGDGCHDAHSIAMWGNKTAGEAIVQKIALHKGVTYDISLCARYRPGNISYANIELRASTTPLKNTSCPAGTCETLSGPKNVTATAWTPYRFQFTPTRDYTCLTVGTSNDIAINGGAQVSWAEVDNIAVTAVLAEGELAPIVNENAPDRIPDQYVVWFHPSTPIGEVTVAEDKGIAAGGTILFRYRTALLGFGAKLPPPSLLEIRKIRGVTIEADRRMKGLQIAQVNPPNGLDRIDQRFPTQPSPNKYSYTETGEGVHVYVIDSGIRTTHSEFGSPSRASGGYSAINDGKGTSDCHGHGTHVAGTIGGAKYGIAKKVTLHAVRVLDCNADGMVTGVIAGVDWVAANKILPAVVNMSLGGGTTPALDTAVTNSIAVGIIYVIAAGNENVDACTSSPARVPTAITVGASVSANDKRAAFSNWGNCLDLFAPGVAILSAWHTSNNATNAISGTSMASPHVAGVAALYLQYHPTANPATVWNALHANNNIATTPGWAGIVNPGNNSPNELLHWGALNGAYADGPHITTIDGTRYDFQSAGEFVLLRSDRLEIQIRQSPIATAASPAADPYDGLATCVTLNTAVAMRIGSHRVTYQPDPNGLHLRIDGVLTPLTQQGIHLSGGGGGRIAQSPVGGLEVHFPDETVLIATPGWLASQNKWHLNLQVARTRVSAGLMGAVPHGGWLPALPHGASMGSMPETLNDRFFDLYTSFADAWRVTPGSGLFDYAPGTSTATFTLPTTLSSKAPCKLPQTESAIPTTPAVAETACNGIKDKKKKADCIADVIVTGEPAIAKTYLASQQLKTGATMITVKGDKDSSAPGTTVTFMAMVTLLSDITTTIPTGNVQFLVDGEKAGAPIKLDTKGRAAFATSKLTANSHQIAAQYIPTAGSTFLASSSATELHTVRP
ncbi:MAG TPA: S8 family serine peptidase [Thermoanaerobaculia bacterium]|jgi:subtilisin family serine protease|nr:S8 family serine peptidase [Thermoanaerobaculia bacterium]